MNGQPQLILTSGEPLPGRTPHSSLRRRTGYHRIRRGVFVRESNWTTLTPSQQHLLEARAADAMSGLPNVWFSGITAAVILGLPLICDWPMPVHQTILGATGGRGGPGLIRHWTGTPPPATVVNGLRVTNVDRTVLDLGRFESVEAGVVAGDYAIRHLGLTQRELNQEVGNLTGRWGVARARTVAAKVDGLSGSVGETRSRLRFPLIGVPAPTLQQPFEDEDGLIGYADFWWPEYGVIGEFDGRVKYEAAEYLNQRSGGDALWAEKHREDRLRALGHIVARWTWADLYDLHRLARILHRAGLPVSSRWILA